MASYNDQDDDDYSQIQSGRLDPNALLPSNQPAPAAPVAQPATAPAFTPPAPSAATAPPNPVIRNGPSPRASTNTVPEAAPAPEPEQPQTAPLTPDQQNAQLVKQYQSDQAGALRYHKSQGGDTEILPTGAEVPKTDQDGNQLYKPGVVTPFQRLDDGQAYSVRRDEYGNQKYNRILDGQNGTDYHTDPQTGEQYVVNQGQRESIGQDPLVPQVNQGQAQLAQYRQTSTQAQINIAQAENGVQGQGPIRAASLSDLRQEATGIDKDVKKLNGQLADMGSYTPDDQSGAAQTDIDEKKQLQDQLAVKAQRRAELQKEIDARDSTISDARQTHDQTRQDELDLSSHVGTLQAVQHMGGVANVAADLHTVVGGGAIPADRAQMLQSIGLLSQEPAQDGSGTLMKATSAALPFLDDQTKQAIAADPSRFVLSQSVTAGHVQQAAAGQIPTDDNGAPPPTPAASQPARNYTVGDDGQMNFVPGKLAAGITDAFNDGNITKEQYDTMLPKAALAEKAIAEQQKIAQENPAAWKAFLTGAGRGAVQIPAGAAGASLGSEIGGALGLLGGPFAEATVPLGAGAGGIIGGFLGAGAGGKAYDAALSKLGQYSDTIKSFQDASALHPYVDAAGNLTAFGAGLPRKLAGAIGSRIAGTAETAAATGTELGTAGATAGEAAGAAGTASQTAIGKLMEQLNAVKAARKLGVTLPEGAALNVGKVLDETFSVPNLRKAVGNAIAGGGGLKETVGGFANMAKGMAAGGASVGQIAKAIGLQAGKGAAGMVLLDTAWKKIVDGEDQTAQGALMSATIGALMSGHGVEAPGVRNEDITNAVMKAFVRRQAGVAMDAPLHPSQAPAGMDTSTFQNVAAPMTQRDTVLAGAFEDSIRQQAAAGKPLGDFNDLAARLKTATGGEVYQHGKSIFTGVRAGEPEGTPPPTAADAPPAAPPPQPPPNIAGPKGTPPADPASTPPAAPTPGAKGSDGGTAQKSPGATAGETPSGSAAPPATGTASSPTSEQKAALEKGKSIQPSQGEKPEDYVARVRAAGGEVGTAMLQRKFKLGYQRAQELTNPPAAADVAESKGSPDNGSTPPSTVATSDTPAPPLQAKAGTPPATLGSGAVVPSPENTTDFKAIADRVNAGKPTQEDGKVPTTAYNVLQRVKKAGAEITPELAQDAHEKVATILAGKGDKQADLKALVSSYKAGEVPAAKVPADSPAPAPEAPDHQPPPVAQGGKPKPPAESSSGSQAPGKTNIGDLLGSKNGKHDVTEFHTSGGTEYNVDNMGHTTRYSRDPGETQGTHKATMPTAFVAPEDQAKLVEAQKAGGKLVMGERQEDGTTKFIEPDKSTDLRGRPISVAVLDRATNEPVHIAHATTTPAVGLHPVEMRYEGGQKWNQIGKAITKVAHQGQPRINTGSGDGPKPEGPEKAEDGHAWVVRFQDGKGVQFYKTRAEADAFAISDPDLHAQAPLYDYKPAHRGYAEDVKGFKSRVPAPVADKVPATQPEAGKKSSAQKTPAKAPVSSPQSSVKDDGSTATPAKVEPPASTEPVSSGKDSTPAKQGVEGAKAPVQAPVRRFEDVVGKQIDANRTAFAPKSGTLSIPRAQMPQVKAEHRGALANFLAARGMAVSEAEVLPGNLKATQADFIPPKVDKATLIRVAGDATPRRILVSSDNHVIDGHHQWLDRLQHTRDEPMPVLRIDAPAREILKQIHEFPSAGMEKAPDLAPGKPLSTVRQSVAQTEITPKDAETIAKRIYGQNQGFLSRQGVRRAKFNADLPGSGIAMVGDQLQIDPKRLAAHLYTIAGNQEALGLPHTIEDAFHAALIEEGIHGLQHQIAQAAGFRDIEDHYSDANLPDEALPADWEDVGRKLYAGWNDLPAWRKKSEYVRMRVQYEMTGKVTEALHQRVEPIVARLDELAKAKGTSSTLQDFIDRLKAAHAASTAIQNQPAKPEKPAKPKKPVTPQLPPAGSKAFEEMSKPATAAPESKSGASQELIEKGRKAFEGLFASEASPVENASAAAPATPATLEQAGLPKERRAQFLDLADDMDAQGINTPEKVAKYLDELAPDGRARKYAQAMWQFIGAADPSKAGVHDWNQVYAALDTPPTQPKEAASSPEPTTFADQVARAVASVPEAQRIGGVKVFIAHAFDAYQAQGGKLPLEDFKTLLPGAQTKGDLFLSRSDLAGAHNADTVRKSETGYLGERFHFIRTDSGTAMDRAMGRTPPAPVAKSTLDNATRPDRVSADEPAKPAEQQPVGRGPGSPETRDDEDAGRQLQPGDVQSGGRVGGKQPEAPQTVGSGRDVVPAGEGRPEQGDGRSPASDGGRGEPPEHSGTQRDVRRPEPIAAGVEPTNFVITDAENIGKGGLASKYRDNIAAIKILKELTAANRPASASEQAVLARYVGWGGLKNAFNPDKADWQARHEELKGLLSEEEFAAARRSIQDAHYTSPTIIKGIYRALEHFGFRGGKMIEGGVGVGHFIGLLPEGMRNNTSYLGIEQDAVTAGIAKLLYPKAQIIHSGFQDADVSRDHFDASAGNPPFGSQKLFDKGFKEASNFSLHNYFIGKQIEALRPGGVGAFVVSHYFLDAKDPSARDWIDKKAEFLGAVRLPNSAFKENANTEVTTDIVFFRKRDVGDTGGDHSWVNTGETPEPGTGKPMTINQHFVDRPMMMLGTPSLSGTMYAGRDEFTLKDRPGAAPLDNQLDEAISRLPADVYRRAQIEETARITAPPAVDVPAGVKVGSHFVADGKIMRRTRDMNMDRQAEPVEMAGDKPAERMRGMIGLRDGLNKLVAAEIADQPGKQLDALRKNLNKQYDGFVAKNGPVNSLANRRVFAEDTDAARVLALESSFDPGVSPTTAKKKGIEARKPSAAKADIFARRVNVGYQEVTKAANGSDALAVSLNQRGSVQPEYMSQLTGKPFDELLPEIRSQVYKNPSGDWETREKYLSGNVRQKLAEARAAAETDPQYRPNVEALEKAQPADVQPGDIHVPIGAGWVDPKYVGDFVHALTGERPALMAYSPAVAKWNVSITGGGVAHTQTYGTPRFPFADIMDALLNSKSIQVFDTTRDSKVLNPEQTGLAQAKAEEVRQKWADWIMNDGERAEKLAGVYNQTFNTDVAPQHNGEHLTFPGKSLAVTLVPHQTAAIARTIAERTVMYDHVVGAGKTFAGVSSIMEMKRLGLARKQMVAVPNHLTAQWRDEFVKLYPNANVLYATPKDFEKANRQKLFARIMTGDHDAVIVGHSSLKKIGMPPEAEAEIFNEMLGEMTSAIEEARLAEKAAKGKGRDSRFISQMEKTKESLEAKLKKAMDATGEKDQSVNFAELGIDGMMIDEAHEFKNLFYATSMQRVAGMGDPAGSGKAFDLYVKTRWLQKQYGGKAPLVFATGTPISNSLVEMYTMQRYLQPDKLKAMGLNHFDAWAKVFGDIKSVYEVDPSGTGYRLSTRLANFLNVGELSTLYRGMADVVTMDDLKAQAVARGTKFPVPKVKGGGPQNIVVPRTEAQAHYFGVEIPSLDSEGNQIVDGNGVPQVSYNPGSILHRIDNMPDDPREDNMLKVTNDARKSSLDMRLIDPNAVDDPRSKVNEAVRNILQTYHEWNDRKGTQLVFCDLSVPASARGKATAEAKAAGNETFIRNVSGRYEIVPNAKSVKVPVAPDLDFYTYKGATGWHVNEQTTGMSVGQGRTAADALAAANEKVGPNIDRMREAIKRQAIPPQEAIRLRDEHEARNAKPEAEEAAAGGDDDEFAEEKGKPAVSMDDLLADGSDFSVYDDMKAKLLAAGIPPEHVAFIHDYDTPDKKQKLFDAMNRGDVRIMFGSTAKMGAGTNVQQRLVGLHHLDAPWRPSDLEQREGRIIRQGNLFYKADPDNFEVSIGRYATKQTYDTRMWQIIEHKAAGIGAFRRADSSTRELADVMGEAANASEMKAAASGDPLIQQEIVQRNAVQKLELQRKGWQSNKLSLDQQVRYLRNNPPQAAFETRAAPWKEIEATAQANPQLKGDDFTAQYKGKAITEKGAVADAFVDAVKTGKESGERVSSFIKYRGVPFEVQVRAHDVEIQAPTSGGKFLTVTSLGASDNFTGVGLVARLDNFLDGRPSEQIDAATRQRDADLHRLPQLETEAAKTFPKQSELDAARAAHGETLTTLKNKRNAGNAPQAPAATGDQSSDDPGGPLDTGIAPSAASQAQPITPEGAGEALGAPAAEPGTIKKAAGKLRDTAERLRAKFTLPYADWIKKEFDSNPERAKVSAAETKNKLRLAGTDMERAAVIPVVQAGGDRLRLQEMLQKVQSSDSASLAAKYTPIYQYALDHLDELTPMADAQRTISKDQFEQAKAAGLPIREREDYVHQTWAKEDAPDLDAGMTDTTRATRAAHRGHLQERDIPDYASGIEMGKVPKSFDIADITAHQVHNNQRVVNEANFHRNLTTINGASDKPILAGLREISSKETEDGKVLHEDKVPAGYEAVGAGDRVLTVSKPYAPIFKALYGTSAVQANPVTRMVFKAVAVAKSYTLVGDTFHLCRTGARAALGFGVVGWKKGLASLDYAVDDLDKAVAAGEMTQEVADFVREAKPKVERLLRGGLLVGKFGDNLMDALDKKGFFHNLPGTREFLAGLEKLNGFTFGTLSRGLAVQCAVAGLDRIEKQNPDLRPAEAARQAAKEVNEFFGNLGNQGVFASKTMQDLARMIFLAPNFAEGMFRTEARGAAQAGKIPVDAIRGKGLRVGNIARALGGMILAMFIGNQVVNLFTKGHATWDNEDDHKLDAWIPGGANGRGFWFSPFSIAAEYSHAMMKYLDAGESPLDAAGHIASNKLSGLARAGKDLATGHDFAGRPFGSTGERVKAAVADAVPLPLPLTSLVHPNPKAALGYGYNGQQGSIIHQLLASAGIKTDPEKSDRAKVFQWAQKFKAPGAAAAASPYSALRGMLDQGDTARGAAEIGRLLADGHKLDKIGHALGIAADGHIAPELFTGSKDGEKKLLASLSVDQKRIYYGAQKEHAMIAQKFRQAAGRIQAAGKEASED